MKYKPITPSSLCRPIWKNEFKENIRHTLLQELDFDLIWFAKMIFCIRIRTWIFKFSLNWIYIHLYTAFRTCFWLVGLLDYDTMQSRTLLPTFRRILLHLTPTLKMEVASSSETLMTTYNTTQYLAQKHINLALLFLFKIFYSKQRCFTLSHRRHSCVLF
jgi:hypothetical protein